MYQQKEEPKQEEEKEEQLGLLKATNWLHFKVFASNGTETSEHCVAGASANLIKFLPHNTRYGGCRGQIGLRSHFPHAPISFRVSQFNLTFPLVVEAVDDGNVTGHKCRYTERERNWATITTSFCGMNFILFCSCYQPPLRIIVYLWLLLTDGEFNDTPHIYEENGWRNADFVVFWCWSIQTKDMYKTHCFTVCLSAAWSSPNLRKRATSWSIPRFIGLFFQRYFPCLFMAMLLLLFAIPKIFPAFESRNSLNLQITRINKYFAFFAKINYAPELSHNFKGVLTKVYTTNSGWLFANYWKFAELFIRLGNNGKG